MNPEQVEQARRMNNRDKVLRLLQQRRRVSNWELLDVGGFRFGGRIHELRREGYIIETHHGDGGAVWYEYRGYVAAGQTRPLFGAA